MRRRMLTFASISGLALFALAAVVAAQEPAAVNTEAMKIAQKVTEQGAATFDTFDAKAMAATYLTDAELVVVTKEDGSLKYQRHAGRTAIEEQYAGVFKNPQTIKSKNLVEYARLIAPDVLVIAGIFDMNTLTPDSPKIPFYQVRVRKGDAWMISSMRIYVLPQNE
jgi:hypothetical protein